MAKVSSKVTHARSSIPVPKTVRAASKFSHASASIPVPKGRKRLPDLSNLSEEEKEIRRESLSMRGRNVLRGLKTEADSNGIVSVAIAHAQDRRTIRGLINAGALIEFGRDYKITL